MHVSPQFVITEPDELRVDPQSLGGGTLIRFLWVCFGRLRRILSRVTSRDE